MSFPHEQEQRAMTLAAIREAGFTVTDVWTYYFSLGGGADEYEVDAYLHGMMSLTSLQCDLLAHAVNEMIDDLLPRRRAPYAADFTHTPAHAPLPQPETGGMQN
jgi:hypothetical protein